MNLIRNLFSPPQVAVDSQQVNVREPISGPVPIRQYAAVGRPMVNDWSAETAIRDAYLMSSIIFRCAKINADKIASLPFRVGNRLPDRPGEVAEFNVNAPLARLLGPFPGSPNPDATPTQIITHAVTQWQTTGRFAWEIEWAGKKVANLWPLIAQYLDPIPTSNRGGLTYFSGYQYKVKGQVVDYNADEVFYAWQPSQYDWHQAESPLQAARLDAAVMIMQDMYDWAFLKNDSRPASVIIHQAFAERDEYEAFKAQFQSNFQGVLNAGKAAFVPMEGENADAKAAMEIKTLGLSQKDSDANARAEKKARNVAIAMGVPWSKLDASGRTYDNADAEDTSWEEETIVPMVSQLQELVNLRLAPKLGKEIGWFDLSSLKCYQRKNVYQPVKATEVFDADGITKNELRVAVGEEPVPDGDKYKSELIPEPTVTAPTEDLVIAPVDEQQNDNNLSLPFGENRNEGAEGVERDHLARVDHVHSIPQDQSGGGLRDFLSEPDSPSSVTIPLPEGSGFMDDVEPAPALTPSEIRAGLWRVVDAQITALEAPFERSMKSLFARQAKSVARSLKGKRGRQMFNRADGDEETPSAAVLFDVVFWSEETADQTGPLYESIMATAGNRMGEDFGIDFDVKAPYVEQFVLERANFLGKEVSDTTYRQIQEAIVQGIDEGDSIDGIADRIQAVFEKASRSRSVTIARTETISAYNNSSFLIGEDFGTDVVAGRVWISAHDSRVRETHSKADGQHRAVNDRFDVDGHQMRFPGDYQNAPASEVVNCRCTLKSITPDEWEVRAISKAQYRKVEEVEAELLRIARSLIKESHEVA